MSDVARPPTLVVIPTFNEADNLPEVLPRVRHEVPDADLLVVDDNSPDGTAKVARELDREVGRVHVLERPGKEGLGPAYRAGFAWGLDRGYERLVQMDADLSHDPASLPRLLAELDRGAVAAIGSRYVPGGDTPHWPLHRRMLSRNGNRYAKIMLGLGVNDATSGFRAYLADTVRAIDLVHTQANGYGFQIELAYRMSKLDGRVAEVPITFTDRVRGTSKMSGRIIVEAMWLVTRWGVRDRLRALGRGARRSRRG